MTRHATSTALSSYLDRQVSDDEARWLAEHLEACPDCRERLEGLRRVVLGLRDLESAPPPPGLGLELQRHVARATPPFAEPGRFGRRPGRAMLPPMVLASLGVVLALAVIMLLFLQALQSRSDGGVDSPSVAVSPQTVEVGGRAFRPLSGGWIETSIPAAEAAAAVVVERSEARAGAPDDVAAALDRLPGQVILRIGDEVVRVVD